MNLTKANNKQKGKIYLNFWVTLILTVLISIGITLIGIYLNFNVAKISDGASRVGLTSNMIFQHNGILLFLLNFIPVLIINIILLFATNNIVVANGITSFIILGLTMVNVNKIIFRQAPLYHYDTALISELAGISKSFTFWFIASKLIIAIIVLVIIIFLAFIIKNNKISLKLRIIGIVIALIAGFFINQAYYINKTLFSSFPVVGNIYNPVNDYLYKGFVYSFIHNFDNSKIEKPEGYKLSLVEDEISKIEVNATIPEKRPHVIMIMSEAYTDIGINNHIDFSKYSDPYKNYKKIKDEGVFGELIVPNVGGGTSDTEFDTLTGLNTRFFRGVPYSYRLIFKPINALPSLLNNIGYNSYAIHPGDAWFYDRANVFPFMGFNELYDINYFDKTDTKGMYITEKQTFNFIKNKFEENLKENPDQPIFNFTVTIQNHGPFFEKYLSSTNFDSDIEFSSDDTNALSNYFEGVQDMDIELKMLTEYFNKIDEPVVFVYFGDHQPSFSPEVYNKLLTPTDTSNIIENKTYLNHVPFFIWQNKACNDYLDIEKNILDEGFTNGDIISDFYLSPILLNAMKMGKQTYYMNYEYDLYKEYPVMLEDIYFDKNGNEFSYTDNENANFYKDINYYRIFDAKQ